MRGHEPVIAMRMKQHRTPVYGIEIATDGQGDLPHRWQEYELGTALVEIMPNENLDTLDLRFVRALRVQVEGKDRQRVLEVFDACIKAGADRVIASVWHWRGEEPRTIEVLDSKGVVTWRK